MQESSNPLAQLLRQLAEFGGGGVMQRQQQEATALGQPQGHATSLTLSLVMAVTLPTSPTAQPVTAPSAANDNAEG